MDIIADILLAAGAVGAAFYCFVLGRRLRHFNDLEKGVGGAVAVLSGQVDDLTKTLENARLTANSTTETLAQTTQRAEETVKRLELMMASLHDIPQAVQPMSQPVTPEPVEAEVTQLSPVKEPSAEPMFMRSTGTTR